MRKLQNGHSGLIMSAAITALLCAVPSVASATTTRVFHAASCLGLDSPSDVRMNSGGQWYSTLSIGTAYLICPLVSDGTVAIPAVSPLSASVSVNAYSNGSNGVGVWVCDQPAGGGSPVCSSTAKWSTGPGGHVDAEPSVTDGGGLRVLVGWPQPRDQRLVQHFLGIHVDEPINVDAQHSMVRAARAMLCCL
jgi:hypothetical protein